MTGAPSRPAARGVGPDGAWPDGARLTITWLGHSTSVIDVDGVRLVTDPLLQRHAGLLRRRGGRPDEDLWSDPDAALLSHLHHDHAELSSLRLLGAVPVLTAPSSARWLVHHGLDGVGLHDGEWARVAGRSAGAHVRVRLCPAVHGDRPMPHRPNVATGHLVRGPSGCVWVAGDTSLYPAMWHLPELAGAPIDVALVPVHGWGPRLSGGHLGPVDAARACAIVRARVAIPVHWGTLHAPAARRLPPGWMDRAGDAFAVALAREAPGCRAVVLAPGQTWSAAEHGTDRWPAARS